MRVMIASSGTYAGTGYGNQVNMLMKYFHGRGHELALIPTDMPPQFIQYREQPYTGDEIMKYMEDKGAINIRRNDPNVFNDYKVYVTNKNPHGWDVLNIHYNSFKADVMIYLRDTSGLISIGNQYTLPENLYIWIPIDHSPVAMDYLKILKNMKKIVTMSEYGKRTLGLSEVESNYIPHCVEFDMDSDKLVLERSNARITFGVPLDAFVCLMVSTNDSSPSRKCIDANLEAFNNFQKETPNSYLVININFNGDIRIINAIILYRIPINKIIVFDKEGKPVFLGDMIQNGVPIPPYYGYITGEMMKTTYLASDVLLYASSSEGFGIPVIEAQYLGCAVVTSNCTSMPENTMNGVVVYETQKYIMEDTAISRLRHYMRSINYEIPDIQRFYHVPSMNGICNAITLIKNRTKKQVKFFCDAGHRFVKENYSVDIIGKMWEDVLGV